MRLKSTIYESTLSTAARSPFPNGEGCETRTPLFSTQRLPRCGRQRGGGFAAQKGSQPRLAALVSPFQGKGLAWTLPPSYGRRCPEGAEVGWGKRDEKEREDRLKSTIYESTLSTAARSPFPAWGRGRAKRARSGTSGMKESEKIVSRASYTSVSLSLIPKPSPQGEGAPKGRIGHWRYERQMRKTEKCAAHVWKA